MANSTAFVKSLFDKIANDGFYPTGFVLSSNYKSSRNGTVEKLNDESALLWKGYLNLPPRWRGSVFMPIFRTTIASFDPITQMKLRIYGEDLDPAITSAITPGEIDRFAAVFGRAVNIIDTLDIATPFLRYREFALSGNSQHWHEPLHYELNNTAGWSKRVLAKRDGQVCVPVSEISMVLIAYEWARR